MVIGAMYVRFVLLLGFRSSVAAISGRVYDGMSTLAPFVVDPGSVLGASPSMHGVVSSMMKEKMSAFGSCHRELLSVFVCDAAMLAATLCRVMRGLPLMEAGPLVCSQDVSAATLASAGAAPLIGSC